jgi:hypothetical protein
MEIIFFTSEIKRYKELELANKSAASITRTLDRSAMKVVSTTKFMPMYPLTYRVKSGEITDMITFMEWMLKLYLKKEKF